MFTYLKLNPLLELIDEPNRSCAKNLYSNYKQIIDTTKGSKTKHHAWPGGYKNHIEECMNIARVLHPSLEQIRELPFSISDSLLTLFVHDLEKPFKYSEKQKYIQELGSYQHYQDFILAKAAEYNFQFTNEHLNAIKYVHGENEDYDPHKNIQGPLAAFINACDNSSARIWFDKP